MGYLDVVRRQLLLILPKISGYVKTFKDNNNKLMQVHIDDNKLLEKYKIIWTKMEDLKNIELDDLPVYDDRYIKTKIRAYDKVNTNFHGLNVLIGGVNVNCLQSFLLICYLFQGYLDTCAYKIVNTQMIDYLKSDGNQFLINGFYKYNLIELI